MTSRLDNLTDHNGHPYPSIDGAYAQAIEVLTDPSAEPWYSFDASKVDPQIIIAISFDEEGNEDQVYSFRLTKVSS